MNKIKSHLILAVIVSLAATAAVTAQTPRTTDRQIQNLLNQIDSKKASFRQELNRRTMPGRRGDLQRNDPQTTTAVLNALTEVDRSTSNFRSDLNSRRANSGHVSTILNQAATIDDLMRRGNMSSEARSQWNALRSDFNTLADHYSISWNWDRRDGSYPGGGFPGGSIDSRITGTYRLNTSLSDRVDTVLDRSLSSIRAGDRDRYRRNLERRLEAPSELALEKRGQTFTIASNLAAPVTVQADGAARTETTDRGRTIRTTATTNQSGVTINTQGDRTSDFGLSFAVDGNNRLRVTRTLYLENQNQAITSTSVYDKTQNVARWPSINGGPEWNNSSAGTFYIPNGTQLTAVLRNKISSRASQPGDRFTMEVTSPSRYRGAMIEGRVAEAQGSGRITGRANISLEFDTIRYNNRTYQFAGIIDAARVANGDSVTINNEGTVRDSSQTTRTVTRAGVGAALGALIGAIAGGGSGAAIGAGIGAGAGAGTVLIQGRDNIEMDQGSEFTITASAPGNVGQVR